MRVRDVIPLQTYWETPLYAYKKPSPATPISRRGDNIWHRDAHGSWQVVGGAFHDQRHRDRDISGENALIATDFYYFGRNTIRVRGEFKSLLAATQGHKNTRDEAVMERFWHWVVRQATKGGRCGDPSDFTEAGCKAQCDDEDDHDAPEEL
jgi:Nucleotide modification associated domain 2